MSSSLNSNLLRDLAPILTSNETWRALASADIQTKYRRTALGPWWIMISNALFALIVGTVSARFLGADMHSYLPYFVTSMTLWNFISSCLIEGSQTLIYPGGQIKASNLPIAFYVMRMIQRNFIILLHNLLVIPLIWIVLPWSLSWTMIFAVIGVICIYISVSALTLIISVICTRYRDIPPLIQTIVQFAFFVSPIIWMPDQLKGGHIVLQLNPIGHALSLVRDPILGRPVATESWVISFGMTAVCVLLAGYVYSKYKNRVVFWV